MLLGFTVIPMATLTGLFYLFTASMQRDEAGRIQNEVAERVSQSVHLHVEKSQDNLWLLGLSLDLEKPDLFREHRTLSNFLFHEREFDDIALARPDGQLTVRLSRFHSYGEDDTESVGAEEGFQRALHGEVGLGDVKASPFSRFPQLRLYVPVMGQLDRVIGVVIDRVLKDVNFRLCEMTEYGREDLIGESARIFYPTQEEFEYVGMEKYRQISERGTGTVETRWRCKSGAIMDVLLSSTPIDSSGYTADVIVNRGVLDQGVNFIQKPFSIMDLAVKVRETLAR